MHCWKKCANGRTAKSFKLQFEELVKEKEFKVLTTMRGRTFRGLVLLSHIESMA